MPLPRPNELWIIDIDGTIINVHANQIPAWSNMLRDVYGVTVDEATLVRYFGKPFTSVLVDVLGHFGIPEGDVLARFDRAFDGYVHGVQRGLEERGGFILPGAVPLLDELGRRRILRCIATGNPRPEAEHKLKHFDLLRYFDITVYADDRRERSELVEEVLRQANRQFGIAPRGKRVRIVGDSRHDIESARRIDALSIAVATGPTPSSVLQQAKPDHLFPSLESYEEILRVAERS